MAKSEKRCYFSLYAFMYFILLAGPAIYVVITLPTVLKDYTESEVLSSGATETEVQADLAGGDGHSNHLLESSIARFSIQLKRERRRGPKHFPPPRRPPPPIFPTSTKPTTKPTRGRGREIGSKSGALPNQAISSHQLTTDVLQAIVNETITEAKLYFRDYNTNTKTKDRDLAPQLLRSMTYNILNEQHNCPVGMGNNIVSEEVKLRKRRFFGFRKAEVTITTPKRPPPAYYYKDTTEAMEAAVPRQDSGTGEKKEYQNTYLVTKQGLLKIILGSIKSAANKTHCIEERTIVINVDILQEFIDDLVKKHVKETRDGMNKIKKRSADIKNNCHSLFSEILSKLNSLQKLVKNTKKKDIFTEFGEKISQELKIRDPDKRLTIKRDIMDIIYGNQ